ncbi:prepilin signal peptidase PulO-like enzyme (type II secretory pathway) [Oikeobacillus pervagus]|uniref:Prepilin signal peptidase PulO-like enzyme (Type II secretory pathway) n=1 Tax=Oikeobacillus pervagus TaxID=1325931 RepID=A0AAJ1T1Z0_9BACI|nr:DUF4282 domain-containing protein [Oikeobacillus pervagus]MDQ0215317.1 prepilin signal peptidase PulO-like enzyme (type II secretory pathway) [Oikeobacillus pervagus]
MNRFLNFDTMITPTLIKLLFWIGVIFSVISGLAIIFAGIAAPFGGGMAVLSGLVTMVAGPLLTRVYCELLIVFFKMHDTLKNIEGSWSGYRKVDE